MEQLLILGVAGWAEEPLSGCMFNDSFLSALVFSFIFVGIPMLGLWGMAFLITRLMFQSKKHKERTVRIVNWILLGLLIAIVGLILVAIFQHPECW